MDLIIIFFGVLIILAGIGILIKTDSIFDYLKRESDNYKLHIFAITLRLILGILLIYYASQSKFPVAIEALGWLAIIAAIALILIGHKNFQKLIDWAVHFIKPFRFAGGILAILLGAFLIYAFL
ncbi:MAG: hypothetical protein RI575_08670 [Balneolaceae bacterium]|nr:hypothetical protein [Balneolaceae bacterium]MDR9407613.1 hypothetical protein [Balneolaceae bacterium]